MSALLPVGLFAADARGCCWYVNQHLVDALGLEVDGDERPVSLVLPIGRPSAGLTGHRATIKVRQAAGASDGLTSSHVARKPNEWTLEAVVLPQLDHTGTISGYLGVVTEGGADGWPAILRTDSHLVDALLDHSPDVISVFNADGSWRYSNAAAWRLLGYQTEFDPAAGVFDLIHPDDVGIARAALDRLLADGDNTAESFELRLRVYDGSWRYFENVAANRLSDPVVRGIIVRSQDITDHHDARIRLLEANQRLSIVVSSLHIAALLEDEHRSIVLTNEAFVDLFEIPHSPGELVGRSLGELGPELSMRFGDPTRDPGPERLTKILRERRRVVGERIFMTDGRILERDFLPIHVDREYRGHLWLFRDVSSQAQAEEEWAELIGAQRAENERLVELDHAKSSFLAEISHELRTPLTSILSFTELLRDGVGSDDPAEQREFLEVIGRNADRLLRLVDDLLLLDRMESGAHPLEWGTIDVPTLVASSVATFAPRAEAKAISLETEIADGPPIAGDPQRVAQLLEVLLSNAIKFTPERGRISVSASPTETEWQLEVADSGIGIPATEQGALFERFYRASNARTARIPGSGLGLAVARAIAKLHGGNVCLENGAGGGTVATVTLPIGRGESTEGDEEVADG